MKNFNKNKNRAVLKNIDLTRLISDHLVGENHKRYHRFVVGVVIMVSGVSFTEFSYTFASVGFHIVGDVVGYFVHGLGAVPFIEYIINKAQDNN